MTNNPIEMPLTELSSERRSGIYMIKNNLNDKTYIGQSRDVYKRINRHKSDLNLKRHVNSYLQNSWNKNSGHSFIFKVIEYCRPEELYSREVFWIEHFKSYERTSGYNLLIPDKENKTFYFDEHTRKKMSQNGRLYTNEELISYLQEFYYMEGRIFSDKDYKDSRYKGFPGKHCFDTVFGSFEKAIESADLSDFDRNKSLRRRNYHTKETIILQYRNFMEKFGRFPNHKERQDTAVYDLPTINAIIKVFGGMKELREALGFTLEHQKELERKESLISLKYEYEKQGYLTYKRVDSKYSSCRSSRYYIDSFGSMDKAYEAAGIDVEENNNRKNYKPRKENSYSRGGN